MEGKRGVFLVLFSLVILSLSSISAGVCSGTYFTSSCTVQSGMSCLNFESQYNDPYWGTIGDGCVSDAPNNCDTAEGRCLREEYYYPYACDEWEYACLGTLTCSECNSITAAQEYSNPALVPQHCTPNHASCSGFSESQCTSLSNAGCSWDEGTVETCSPYENRVYTCSGTYYTSTYHPASGYCYYVGDGSSGGLDTIQASLPLITGNLLLQPIDGGSGSCESCDPATVYCPTCATYNDCEWYYQAAYTSSTPHSCSSLSESACESTSGCIKTVTCEPNDYYKDDCYPCSTDDECISGKCKATLTGGEKRCSPATSCPLNLYSSCLVSENEDKCVSGDIYTCTTSSSWIVSDNCVSGSCTNNPAQCVAPTPSPYWTNVLGSQSLTSVSASIDPENSYTIYLRLKDAILSGMSSGTFSVTETVTGTSLGTISASVSGNDLIATWIITNSLLDTVNNGDESYSFRFSISTYTSPTVVLTRSFSTCFNSVLDGDELDVDCGGSCSASCCGNGNCNSGEDNLNCEQDCPLDKILQWSGASSSESSPYQLSLSDLAAENTTFNLEILNYADSGSTFEIREHDALAADDSIRLSLGATSTSSTSLSYLWYPNYDDFTASSDGNPSGEPDGIYEFYFEVDGETSPYFYIELVNETGGTTELPNPNDGICQPEFGEDEITAPNDCQCYQVYTCSDYDQANCGVDPCGVINNTVINGDSSCEWNELSSTCSQVLSVQVDGIDIGKCVYSEDTSLDTCDDGFLSYSWTALWDWGNNVYNQQPTPSDGYLEHTEGSGEWHYDPQNSYLECEGGETTIPCPAQVQLSFFTWKNMVAAIILIAMIYLIIKQSKNKPVKKNTNKKVTPAAKKVVKKESVKKVAKKKISNKKKI